MFVNNYMIFFRTFFILILVLISTNGFALMQKPSIAVFIIEGEKKINAIKLPITSHLNQKGFITKDGNTFLKKINKSNKNNLQFIIENSDVLSSLSKTELLLTIKVNNYIENKNSIKISLTSEIYNSNTKTFISSWSTPIKVINFLDDCDLICKNLLVSEAAILLSNQLGESIIRILNAQSRDVKNYQNISKVYNFKLLNFNQNDIIYLTDIMINEFPGFIKISNEESFGKQSTWNYYSSSEMVKLKKWLVISLNEINLNLNKDYELIISENNFFINKFPKFNTYGTKGNPEKFN
tara:strand:+ start:402 stop:1286 length:885 start_codon:yes stop_codon:yes gene_type:complete